MLRIEEISALFVGVALLVIYFSLGEVPISIPESFFEVFHYIFFVLSYYEVFLILFLFVIFFIWAFHTFFYHVSRKYLHFDFSKTINNTVVFSNIRDILRSILVLLVAHSPSVLLLTKYSYILKYHTRDVLLLNIDKFIFGVTPFTFLPTILNQNVFTIYFYVMYYSLFFVLVFSFVFFFIVSKDYFYRILFTCFIFSMIMVWPVYIHFPALDPGNYFIRNFHEANNFQPIEEMAKGMYTPNTLTKSFIQEAQAVETVEYSNSKSVPITCFPSMHAIWALFCVILFSKYNRRFLPIMAIWYISMLTGGVYFAQHYVIDYIVAIPIGVATFLFSTWLIKRDTNIFEIKKMNLRTLKDFILP